MGKSLKDNLRMAILARANDDQAVKARMDSMDATVEPGDAPPPRQTVPAEQPSRPIQQSDKADQSNRGVRQRNSTEGPNRRVHSLNPTLQQTNPTDESNKQIRQMSPAGKSSRQTKQTNPADQSSRASTEPLPIRIGARPGVVTPAQKTILEYFRQIGSHVSTYRVIAKETSVPHGTVRCVIDKFVNLGILCREPWGSGSYRALRFIVCDTEQTSQAEESDRRAKRTNPTD